MKKKLMVKEINFYGDTLKAAKDKDGIVWVGIKWLCDGMGLSEGQRQRQTTNIQSDIVLSKGVANLQLPTNGGSQEVLCLQLDYLPLWLAKIAITPTMKQNNPELVEKLVKYQLKAKDALAAAFLPEAYWQEMRQESKNTRQIETDSIKTFVAYAREQGSQHADRYYCSLTRLANKAAGITCRNEASINQLSQLALIEHIIAEVIQESIRQRKPYKEIYLACKGRVSQFQEIAYLSS